MPTGTAVKVFDIVEESLAGGYYKITVSLRGHKVKEYVEPTMRGARRAFQRDGFKLVAWAEKNRIVLQGDCE
jgi:hypothetical protein